MPHPGPRGPAAGAVLRGRRRSPAASTAASCCGAAAPPRRRPPGSGACAVAPRRTPWRARTAATASSRAATRPSASTATDKSCRSAEAEPCRPTSSSARQLRAIYRPSNRHRARADAPGCPRDRRRRRLDRRLARGDRVLRVADRRVLKENGGQASAFNAGFAASDGDVVVFLDADDLLEPHIVAGAIAAIQGSPTPRRSSGGWSSPTPMAVRPARSSRRDTCRCRAATCACRSSARPFDIPWMATSGNAFPAAVLDRVLPMPEREYRVNADWYLQHLTPLLGPVVALGQVGALRRVHGANAYEQAAGRGRPRPRARDDPGRRRDTRRDRDARRRARTRARARAAPLRVRRRQPDDLPVPGSGRAPRAGRRAPAAPAARDASGRQAQRRAGRDVGGLRRLVRRNDDRAPPARATPGPVVPVPRAAPRPHRVLGRLHRGHR